MSELENLVKAIHDNVGEYCQRMHNFEFNPEQPVVRLHEPTFSADEINVAIDVLLSTRVTMGAKVKNFEKEFAKAYSHRHGVMNNSGSSAMAIPATWMQSLVSAASTI
jgi:CDP-4-dehydro-6-deoxyglucose reductase, E1